MEDEFGIEYEERLSANKFSPSIMQDEFDIEYMNYLIANDFVSPIMQHEFKMKYARHLMKKFFLSKNKKYRLNVNIREYDDNKKREIIKYQLNRLNDMCEQDQDMVKIGNRFLLLISEIEILFPTIKKNNDFYYLYLYYKYKDRPIDFICDKHAHFDYIHFFLYMLTKETRQSVYQYAFINNCLLKGVNLLAYFSLNNNKNIVKEILEMNLYNVFSLHGGKITAYRGATFCPGQRSDIIMLFLPRIDLKRQIEPNLKVYEHLIQVGYLPLLSDLCKRNCIDDEDIKNAVIKVTPREPGCTSAYPLAYFSSSNLDVLDQNKI